MEKRSWIVTATVIVVAAMVGLGAGVTTALVGRDDPAAADTPADTASSTGVSSGTPSDSPDTTAATTSTPSTPTTTAPGTAAALYYADGTIHDGDQEIAYQPRFQSTVANLSRVLSGWVVKERFGQDGARLVLVAADGSATPVGVKDPHWYAVSPEGTGLAVPDYDDPNQIDFIDTGDGSVISSLTATSGSRVVNAVFTGVGDDLLILSDDVEGGESTLALYHADADGYDTLQSPPGGATSRLIGADSQGTRVLLEYLLRNKPCVTVLDLTDDATPMWKSCQYRPLGGAGVSPNGDSVALATASAGIGTVTVLSVLDADSGGETGAVRISSGFRLIDATWADSTQLVVQGANDAFTEETIDICTIGSECISSRDASPDNPARDVAPGS
jgi:hypothetical protein